MLVSELIAALSRLPQTAEIRLAEQPSWPFEYEVSRNIVGPFPNADDGSLVCYIAEGEQIAYLNDAAVFALAWDNRP